MTDQEMRLATDSLLKRLPALIGEPLAQFVAESFGPVYVMGFAFGAGVSISSLMLVLAWKGMMSAWWAVPFALLAVQARKGRTRRIMIKHGLKVAGDCDVKITVHPTGFIEIERQRPSD